MVHDGVNWRKMTRRAALLLAAAVLPFALPGNSAVHAQSIMRTPSLHIDSRIPSINPTVAPRINPTIAGRTGVGVNAVAIARTPPPRVGGTTSIMRIDRPVGVGSGTPYLRYSPNLYPVCEYANRGPDGECFDRPVNLVGSGGGGGVATKKGGGGPAGNPAATAANLRTVQNEFVAEIDGAMSFADADALARSHGLERIASQNFPLVGGTIGLFRIVDRRPSDTVRAEFAADTRVKSVQPNFRYVLQEQKLQDQKTLTEGDPGQYAVAQLRLPQAHTLARGMNVTIAVIDSGIDVKHPELANSVADSFDALGSKEGPHVHGTGIAGAIVAHARLMGSAPEARLLAIRAFGSASGVAESNSYVILKGLDYAVEHGAQIVNMSFAGPKDPMIERGIAATAARGVLLVAAAGNAGAKSPPLYPAANPNVIAVSGTDAQDRLFTASNRGNYIAIAAPGADIFLPAPDEKYQITSGTSFSAAYVSGIAALIMERNPALKPNDVRAILTRTARDLGAPGRDDLFGAGEADAFAAVTAAVDAPFVPVAAASPKPAGEKPPAPAAPSDNASVSRALKDSAPSLSSDKSAANDANRAAAQ
ncbi:S8 family serine peptidase [Bradyrhizobium sp. KBS0727]|uniref:S8 family serine peptidase n=1 Tax=unclassified Bradyrhizobium TaxID=2631580 RepID=UPI00110DC6DC|nr:S8 family serine peptidase [Bradyrhizobium sp. KBS0725]QDW44292.1 S8 family serine peptidase [Bradyrhizobium sp. KBS0727]